MRRALCTRVVPGWHPSWQVRARLWLHRWQALRRGRKSHVPVVQGRGQGAHRWQASSEEKEILCASRAVLCVPVRARRLCGVLVVTGGVAGHAGWESSSRMVLSAGVRMHAYTKP